jgi:hypothetical protein
MVSAEGAEDVICQFCGVLQPLTAGAYARLGLQIAIPNSLDTLCTLKPNGSRYRLRFGEYSDYLGKSPSESCFELLAVQAVGGSPQPILQPSQGDSQADTPESHLEPTYKATSSSLSSASVESKASDAKQRLQDSGGASVSSWGDITPAGYDAVGLVITWWTIMQKFSPEKVFQPFRTFAIADGHNESRTNEGYKFTDPEFFKTVTDACEQFVSECNAMGLQLTCISANSLLAYLQKNKKWDSTTHFFLTELGNRLRDELQTRAFLTIPPQKLIYFNVDRPLFGVEVDGAFPSAKHDIAETGSAFACARNTASVFHSMRIMEYGIYALAKSLGIPEPIEKDRSWGKILGKIKGQIELRAKSKDHAWKIRVPKLENAHAYMHAVKNAWRDETMHVGNKYDEQEAENILIATRSFVRELATFLDESGKFKIP